jgi:hypothetical protein
MSSSHSASRARSTAASGGTASVREDSDTCCAVPGQAPGLVLRPTIGLVYRHQPAPPALLPGGGRGPSLRPRGHAALHLPAVPEPSDPQARGDARHAVVRALQPPGGAHRRRADSARGGSANAGRPGPGSAAHPTGRIGGRDHYPSGLHPGRELRHPDGAAERTPGGAPRLHDRRPRGLQRRRYRWPSCATRRYYSSRAAWHRRTTTGSSLRARKWVSPPRSVHSRTHRSTPCSLGSPAGGRSGWPPRRSPSTPGTLGPLSRFATSSIRRSPQTCRCCGRRTIRHLRSRAC